MKDFTSVSLFRPTTDKHKASCSLSRTEELLVPDIFLTILESTDFFKFPGFPEKSANSDCMIFLAYDNTNRGL